MELSKLMVWGPKSAVIRTIIGGVAGEEARMQIWEVGCRDYDRYPRSIVAFPDTKV